MLGRLFLLFVGVPLVELAILVQLGRVVGLWPTIGLVLVTGALGAALARSQGARVLRDMRAEMAVGRVPAGRLLDGLMILAGGLVLLTPGLLTDVAGLLLLLPPSRAWFKRRLRRRLERMVASGQATLTIIQ